MTFGLRRIAAVSVAVLLVFGLGACGKKKSSDNGAIAATTTSAASAGAATTTTAAPAAGGDALTIEGFKFSPASLSVKAGATVNVTNKDGAPHTVTANDATSFDTKTIAGGASGSFTAPKAGSYPFHCEIHKSMTGTLVVT